VYGNVSVQTPGDAGCDADPRCEEPSDEIKVSINGVDKSLECSGDINFSPDIRNLAPLTGDDEDSDSSVIVKNADLAAKNTRSHRFVLKLARGNTQDTCHLWRLGAILDLAREAKFLSLLNHPNIIEMHATVGDPGHPEFAIVLERLVLTLDKAIKQWSDELKNQRKHLWLNFPKSQPEKRAFELKRLVVMNEIANAVHHLHVNK
jgi:hypothetical protein